MVDSNVLCVIVNHTQLLTQGLNNMGYQFPKIHHIDDVRAAIAGRDEFIIAERDWGYVVNYMVNMIDTFPPVMTTAIDIEVRDGDEHFIGHNTQYDLHAAIRRECRGILFHKDGKIMARRLHKFFNVNERDETQMHCIDLNRSHVILEKLDGSMITPVVTDAGIRWGTKMGITDVGMGAELFVAQHNNYEQLARDCITRGMTPIFEWCSRKQRIVIDYPEDRLVLLAIRHNVTGEYVGYADLLEWGRSYNIDVVRAYDGTAANMERLLSETRDVEGMEGWIIRFEDGEMHKIKGEWYCRIHKTKDNLNLEKNLIKLIVTDKLDDSKAFMLDDDRRRVEQFENDFWEGIAKSVEGYDRYYNTVVASGLDRKRYAQEWMPTIKKNDPVAPMIVFGKFDGKDTRAMLVAHIRKHTGTQTTIDSVRHLWKDIKWTYHFEGDN